MTIEEAAGHLGERVTYVRWDGSTAEGFIGCVAGREVFVRRHDAAGMFGSPEHVTLACPADDGTLF